jgi:hypothetical protein
MGTYRYKVTDDFLLEPSGIVRLTERTPAQLDVYLRGWYNQMAWLSFGYRTNDALILGIGGEYGPFSLSYAYDVTSTGAQYFSPHSHEMTLTYFVPRSSGFNSKSMGNRRILGRNRLVK